MINYSNDITTCSTKFGLIIFLCRDTVKTASYIAKRELEADHPLRSRFEMTSSSSLYASPYLILLVFCIVIWFPRDLSDLRLYAILSLISRFSDFSAISKKNGRDSNPGRLGAGRRLNHATTAPPKKLLLFCNFMSNLLLRISRCFSEFLVENEEKR